MIFKTQFSCTFFHIIQINLYYFLNYICLNENEYHSPPDLVKPHLRICQIGFEKNQELKKHLNFFYKTAMQNSNVIAKEHLGMFRFSPSEVLKGEWEKVYRNFTLQRAERLGNSFKGKVRIFFRTHDNEIKVVDTTVWATSDDYVSLKGGMSIPVRSILGVEF